MDRFSKFVQINILLSFAFIIVGIYYPYLEDRLFYAYKAEEATSVSELIARGEANLYAKNNHYKAIKRGDIKILVSSDFNINGKDLKYYDYLVTTTSNSFTIEAVPKTKYLKSRSVRPKVYVYQKTLNQTENKSWK